MERAVHWMQICILWSVHTTLFITAGSALGSDWNVTKGVTSLRDTNLKARFLQSARSSLICNDSRNCSVAGQSSRNRRVNCSEGFIGESSSINSQGPCRRRRIVLDKDHLLRRRRKSTASDLPRYSRGISHQNKDALHRLRFQSIQAFAFVHLRLTASYAVSFQFKTIQPNGLVMYTGSQSKHFVAIDLVDGVVHYSYDVGRGPRVMRVSQPGPLHDNRWHTVEVLQPSPFEHILRVDNASKADVIHDVRATHLDVDEKLYFGGVPEDMYDSLPKQVKSRAGYLGCLASVTIRKEFPSNTEEIFAEIPEEFLSQVQEGCHEEGVWGRCSPETCSNGGICQQEMHSYSCDCDMTSFIGETCEEDGIAYKFGAEGGLMIFTFGENEKMNTRQDSIAFGFITTQSDAVLVRVTSGSMADYIEVELIDGNIFVVYNIGTADHPIGELFQKVNDNNYHILRFQRLGANSTLQLDNFPVQRKFPTGRQVSAFNNMERVFIGGKTNAMEKLVKPFHGTISGLVVNERHLLELAAEGDERISVEGDTELVNKPRPYRYISTSSNAVLLRLQFYNRTMPSDPRMQHTVTTMDDADIRSPSSELQGPCQDPGNQNGCRSNRGDAAAAASSSSSPARLQGRRTTRSSQPFGVSPENRISLSSSSSTIGPCTKQNGCHNSGTSPAAANVKFSLPAHNISSFSQKLDFSGRTHPMFLSHLEPAMNPTYAVSNVTESNGQTDDSTDGQTGKGGRHQRITSGPSFLQIAMAIGISVGVLLFFFILAYATYKYRSRDEGTYRIDEGNGYGYDVYNSKPLIHLNGRAKYSRQKSKDNKEWYV